MLGLFVVAMGQLVCKQWAFDSGCLAGAARRKLLLKMQDRNVDLGSEPVSDAGQESGLGLSPKADVS